MAQVVDIAWPGCEDIGLHVLLGHYLSGWSAEAPACQRLTDTSLWFTVTCFKKTLNKHCALLGMDRIISHQDLCLFCDENNSLSSRGPRHTFIGGKQRHHCLANTSFTYCKNPVEWLDGILKARMGRHCKADSSSQLHALVQQKLLKNVSPWNSEREIWAIPSGESKIQLFCRLYEMRGEKLGRQTPLRCFKSSSSAWFSPQRDFFHACVNHLSSCSKKKKN